MDSMRSLNTSLPRSPRKQAAAHPPEQLIQAFKNAALSVTNLYKTAAAEQSGSRLAGYQDALDDLLTFLDQENIGLDDGEGWRVRRWATERLDDGQLAQNGTETDDDAMEAVKSKRSTSPTNHERQKDREVKHRSLSPQLKEIVAAEAVASASASASTPSPLPAVVQPNTSKETFTFRSSHPYPHDAEMETTEVAAVSVSASDPTHHIQPNPSIKVEVLSRTPRSTRSSKHHSRNSTAKQLGLGAGTKRRIAFGDYFDIGSLGDSPGPNKRSKGI